jgi:predicted permease
MSEHQEPKWRRYLRLARPNPAADLDDELRDHIESAMEALIARGMSPQDARAEALRRFGDVTRVQHEVQQLDARHATAKGRVAWFETFLYDLRHGARALRRSPGFAFVAALSIALGVAANTTVFSVVNALLLRPIPGTHGDRLMRMYMNHHSPFDWRDLSWFRARATSLENVVGERYSAMAFRAAASSESERVQMSWVTQGYFRMLGVDMALGRAFDVDDEGGAAAEPVAVLTHGFWQRRFAGDSSVIGKTILLGEHPVTVVGVTAPEFRSSVMLWAPSVLVPLSMAPILTGRPVEEFGGSFYTTVQLEVDATPEGAESELRTLMAQLATSDTARYERTTVRLDHVRGINAELRQAVTAGSVFLMGMVALVLLIACANVANLLLGRAAARRTEIGVRLAIGASKARLVRQMLTESLLLAVLGSALGFASAWFLTRIMASLIPAEAGLDQRYFTPDARVLAFTALVCVITTFLFGALPAFRSASPNLITLIKGSETHVQVRKRGWLVPTQTAMCVLLLAVAATFLRSLASMRTVDPGFRADGILDVTIDLALAGRMDSATRVATFTRIVESARELPGVERATLTAIVPLSGSNMETRVLAEGKSVASRSDAPSTYFHVVGEGYFSTMDIPVRGREFGRDDRGSASAVAVISETAARRLFPQGSALGKRFHWGGADGELLEVVGVARDADYVMPGEAPRMVVYVPFAREPRAEMVLQLKTATNLTTVETTRRAVWDLLRGVVPTLPPPPVTRMMDDMAITLLPVRLGALLLGAFGALALVLAAAGIYGVAAYSVARRTREIGIRAALGATRTRLVRMVLWESGRRVGVGAVAGLLVTLAVSAALSKVLYGVQPLDLFVLGGVAAIMTAVAIIATLAPAGRAARTDPVKAMRTE